jgi:hypothetical protein
LERDTGKERLESHHIGVHPSACQTQTNQAGPNGKEQACPNSNIKLEKNLMLLI